MQKILLTVLAGTMCSFAFAQQGIQGINYSVEHRNTTGAASYIKFNSHDAHLDGTFMTGLKAELQLNDENELKLVKSEIDRIGYKHYRFQQYYKGILVKGGEYLVHEKQGYITSANGTVYR